MQKQIQMKIQLSKKWSNELSGQWSMVNWHFADYVEMFGKLQIANLATNITQIWLSQLPAHTQPLQMVNISG